MESAFAWVSQLMEWLASFVPRVRIVRSTHAGVRFRHGKTAVAMRPGVHIFWPIVTEVEIIPVARQTHNLPSQSLLTKDGHQVVVGGVVIYAIKDIVATLSRNWDVNDTINDITMVAITEIITSHDLEYIQTNVSDEVQKKLTQVTGKQLRRYGVKVYKTALTDFSTAFILKNIGGSAIGYGASLED
jgi:regulator of protease activity HflC (stomatin/prohibitin superfamily)